MSRITFSRDNNKKKNTCYPTVIPQGKHPIALKHLNRNVQTVLTHLHEAGFEAYLVGGGVRDLLLGLIPKDFDIATDARPEEIKKLFRNCRLIGKRFRLAHIFFGRDILEVATFRASHPETEHPDARQSDAGVLLRDNIYGTLEDDALRRDFSVNALYFDIRNLSVLDYTNGMADIEKRIIRVLGNPTARYKEDPVRMLRAIRLAAKLNFHVEEEASKAITNSSELILHASPARLFDEIVKLFYCGHSLKAFALLRKHGLFEKLFPATHTLLTKNDKKGRILNLIEQGCKNTDQRIQQNMSLNPAFLFAVLLWGPLQRKIKEFKTETHSAFQAAQMAMRKILHDQQQHTMIPKRFTVIIQEIWSAQYPLEKHTGKRANHVFSRPRFRAAYDFLALRAQAGEKDLQEIVEWWRVYQEVNG